MLTLCITLSINHKKWNKHHWPQKKLFKFERLKPLSHDTAFNFYFRHRQAMSMPVFKDFKKVLKEKFKFIQSKDLLLFKHKIHYKKLLTKNWKSFESNTYKCIASKLSHLYFVLSIPHRVKSFLIMKSV